MSDAASHQNRFASAGRRKVSDLAMIETSRGPLILGLYVAATLLAAPLVLRLGWYTNEAVTIFGLFVCGLILLMPAVGLVAAAQLLGRCKTIAEAAEIVDRRTQSLLDDSATLQASARESLNGFYEADAKASVAIVNTLKSDALRRAIVDRWEPSSWLVDAHQDELSAGLPLILMLQRLALQFGILFTFIGLGVAFSSEAFSKSGSVGTIPDMQPLIDALRVKFTASIAGLISSICLLIIAGFCRRQLTVTMVRLDVMVDNILTLAKTMRSDPAFASEFSQLRENVQRMNDRIDGLADGYAKVVTTVREGVGNLAVAREELAKGLASLLGAQKQVVAEIDQFYGRIAPENFAEEVGKNVHESMTAFTVQISETNKAMESLNFTISTIADAERAKTDQATMSTNQHQELLAALRAVSDSKYDNELLRSLSASINALASAVSAPGGAIAANGRIAKPSFAPGQRTPAAPPQTRGTVKRSPETMRDKVGRFFGNIFN